MWTESIAVGDEDYVAETKSKLSSMAIGREIIPNNSVYELREPLSPYCTHFDTKSYALRLENTFFWSINYNISDT